jgi:hypothetical protein
MGGVVGAVIGGVMANKAADKAADAQIASANQAQEFQREALDKIIGLQKPFVELGTNNINAFQQLLTPEGQANFVNNNAFLDAINQQSTRDISNTRAAQGLNKSGATLKALRDQNLINANALLQDQFNRLGGAVNSGQNAAAFSGNAFQNAGSNFGNLALNKGDTAAAESVASANIFNNTISDITQQASQGMVFGM